MDIHPASQAPAIRRGRGPKLWLCRLAIAAILALVAHSQPFAHRTADESSLLIKLLALEAAQQEEAKKLLDDSRVSVTPWLVDRLLAEARRSRAVGRQLFLLSVSLAAAQKLAAPAVEGLVWRRLGQHHLRRGSMSESRAAFEKSRALFDSAQAAGPLSLLLAELGDLYLYFGEYAAARGAATQSLTLIEYPSVQADVTEMQGARALASATVGLCDLRDGEYGAALAHFARALDEYRKLQRFAPAYRSQVAETLRNIGRAHRVTGDYARALAYFNEALEANGGADGRQSADTLNSIGLLYAEQRNYEQAAEHYARSLAAYRAANDRSGLATVELNFAVVLLRQGRAAEAVSRFRTSLSLAEADGYKEGVLTALKGLGAAHHALGEHAAALDWLEKSLALAEVTGDKTRAAEAHWHKAEVYYSQKSYTAAVREAQQSLVLSEHLSLPNVMYLAATALGRARLAENDHARAEEAFSLAVKRIEEARATVAGVEQDRQFFFQDKLEAYRALARLALTRGDAWAALARAEQAKARVLLDLTRLGRSGVAETMTPAERQREQELRAAMVSQRRHFDAARPGGGVRGEDAARQLEKARMAYEAFQAGLSVKRPATPTQRSDLFRASAAHVRPLIPDAQTALLEYAVTGEEVTLFVLTLGADGGEVELKTYSLAVTPTDLKKRIAVLRAQIAGRRVDFFATARALYDILLKPAEGQLAGKTKLCIVPDGHLWLLPFQALLTGEQKYVLERHVIRYAPSLSFMREAVRKVEARSSPAKPASQTLLAVGDPAFATPPAGLTPLPEAGQEVSELARIYGSRDCRILTGVDAGEEEVKSAMAGYRMLHFATHGVLDDLNPMYSHLALASPRAGAIDDGLLEAWEVTRLGLSAELAVLSACDTAGGRVSEGEGLIGMAWAFLAAGVSTAVVSQWKADSAATGALMARFHRELARPVGRNKRSEEVADALRLASLSLMKQPSYRHPYFWAGFVAVGGGD
jgi:CHAT domain-containing protein